MQSCSHAVTQSRSHAERTFCHKSTCTRRNTQFHDMQLLQYCWCWDYCIWRVFPAIERLSQMNAKKHIWASELNVCVQELRWEYYALENKNQRWSLTGSLLLRLYLIKFRQLAGSVVMSVVCEWVCCERARVQRYPPKTLQHWYLNSKQLRFELKPTYSAAGGLPGNW